MIQKQPFSEQRIIDCLCTNYGIAIDTLNYLALGADMNASVYKAQSQGHSYFLKLKRGHAHSFSVRILGLLEEVGIDPIIPPIKTVLGLSAQPIDEFTLIVYPFIEGQDGFSHQLTDEQWRTLGKALRQVHEVVLPSSIHEQIRLEEYSPKWRQALRALYAHSEAGLVGDQVTLKLLRFMSENKTQILSLVEHAEILSQSIKTKSSQFVLCHSDIHGGNVFIAKSGTLYIVDWDEPILASKERDLMFIGGGVGNVWNNPHEETLFYQGYGKTDLNMEALAYYRSERIVEDIVLYGNALLLSTSGGEDRTVMYKHFTDMFESNGVVDIALKTAEGVRR